MFYVVVKRKRACFFSLWFNNLKKLYISFSVDELLNIKNKLYFYLIIMWNKLKHALLHITSK